MGGALEAGMFAAYGPFAAAALPSDTRTWLLWGGATALFGALLGAAELLTRFRDEPWAAVVTKHGIGYMLINAAVSVAVLALLAYWHDSTFPEMSIVSLAIVSGFGAMAILRSKLFTFRTKGGEDVPIGLDAVVRAFLQAADRGVDRDRADARWATTQKHVGDVTDDAKLVAWLDAIRTHVAAYQSLTRDDVKMIEDALAAIKAGGEGIPARAVRAGLLLQEVSGTRTFKKVATAFRAANDLAAIK